MTTTYPNSALSELRAHIDSMLEVVTTGRGRIRARLKWEAGKTLSRLKADDLITGELAAHVAVLHAAHARVITPPTGGRPVLRIVPKAREIGSEI